MVPRGTVRQRRSMRTGEYRGRVLPWAQFAAFREKYDDILSFVEGMVLDKMENEEILFQADFYYPKGSKSHGQAEDIANNLRLPINLFTICWLYDYFSIEKQSIENHVNPAYQYIIHQEDDEDLFDHIVQIVAVHLSLSISLTQMLNNSLASFPSWDGSELRTASMMVTEMWHMQFRCEIS